MGTEVKTLYGYFAPNSERILGPVSLNRLHLVSEIKQDSSAKLWGLYGAACSSHTGEAEFGGGDKRAQLAVIQNLAKKAKEFGISLRSCYA